ncbi:MAG: hypothetical protein IM492_19865 [Microcystis sp. M040S2]|uniref:hypothetical protein n=1 Tax=unclassified Microcystis TaxID=2643300 RepID=UPI002588FAF3|nr:MULTISPECIES: hypothetical protein [unclassified Microcystis]MCA2619995.1 hypothetical protein [Microcystis sp. M099S2]MCA2679632.1 hypothetical protein [Microcystis sp. M043S2]MCA2826533.1 hypothetical protein [Microcystis sp. M088S1]MCA2829974.1 hypothetical protein [Microcystis sp. M086S1]MCA2858706.1 hypothetical protein [Microcystis sp. M005S1]MCA2915637.1 hypothetical protein [Microcystis sp. M022S1]MCA2923863.1 hypothetical protein [Microcystis sp. M038S1]MCA2924809.1 hypothetical
MRGWEVGKWGRGEVGKWGRGDVGTWGRGEVGRINKNNLPSPVSCLGSSRLCVIIFAYGIVKCLSSKTFRAILRIFHQYRPRFHTETRRALSPISCFLSPDN